MQRISTEVVFALLIGALVALTSVSDLSAQARRPFKGRSVKTPVDLSLYDFNLGTEVNKIFTTGADTDLDDPLTIANLRQLKEAAQPSSGLFIEDIDPYEARRVVEKAFAMQSTRSVLRQVNESELRSTYVLLKQEMDQLLSWLRYSVQDDGESLSFQKENRGEKLLELSFQFSIGRGADPQVRFGDNFRLRYNYMENAPTFEYFVDF